jgi:hypothetical protein
MCISRQRSGQGVHIRALRCVTTDPQGGLIPFEIGVSVVGDVTIAVWLGSHNMGERIHARPSFAYAFHTGVCSGLLAKRMVTYNCCSMLLRML